MSTLADQKLVIAGASGSVIGCFLKQAGHDVIRLGRSWHLDAIGKQGLRVDGVSAEHHTDGFFTAYNASTCTGSLRPNHNRVSPMTRIELFADGETLGVPTPYHEVVTRLIWQREYTPCQTDTGECNSNCCRSYVK